MTVTYSRFASTARIYPQVQSIDDFARNSCKWTTLQIALRVMKNLRHFFVFFRARRMPNSRLLRPSLSAIFLLAIATNATTASAQTATPAATPLQFDVISIKPSGMDPRTFGALGYWKGTYRSQGWPLTSIILNAYLPPIMSEIVPRDGFPSWTNNERYDIVAKVDGDTAARLDSATEEERTAIVQAMVQKMLAERFGLVVHRVPVDVQGYALVVARKGPALARSQPGDMVPEGFRDLRNDGKVRMIAKRGHEPEIDYFHVSISQLVEQLSRMRQLLLVDQTGLDRTYNFSLVPLDEAPVAGDESGPRDTRVENPFPWDLRPLGLELKPIRVKTETIVIDSIHRPSTN